MNSPGTSDHFLLEKVEVTESEFARHLGYKDPVIPEGLSRDVAASAEAWFKEQARPFSASCSRQVQGITDSGVRLGGNTWLNGTSLAARLSTAGVHSLTVLAVSAGEEVDREIQHLWDIDRPDAAYALNAYAAAFTEALLRSESAARCLEAEARGEAQCTPFSPGYEDWPTSEQEILLNLLKETHPTLPLQVLPSSLLVPQKSQIAVLGTTRMKERVVEQLVPCESCSFNPCHLRRAPFKEPAWCAPQKVSMPSFARNRTVEPAYRFPEKALSRWADRFVSLDRRNGGIRAAFSFEGSTCCDGGIPLAFLFQVDLTPQGEGYRIDDMTCQPTDGDQGYSYMCSFRTESDAYMKRLEQFRPLLGQPLSEAMHWDPVRNPAGCLCSQANRNHKWLMALQTIHYALQNNQH